MQTGVIKKWQHDSGWGFIEGDDGDDYEDEDDDDGEDDEDQNLLGYSNNSSSSRR